MKLSTTPPFDITHKVLKLSLGIQSVLSELKNIEIVKPSLKLRKQNKIRTIHHSLAIEGNTLTLDQVSDVIDNKIVFGPKKEILEVKNALKIYDSLNSFSMADEKHFLKAHSTLMSGLVATAGRYRNSNVGILKGSHVSHVAPQAKLVPGLMSKLFQFLKKNQEISLLIKACVFHYELEFIHPFEDGNGRMGRLWQQVVLRKLSTIFEYLSVETLIHKNQKKYYAVLEKCDTAGTSTLFIEFSLELILEALQVFKNEYKPKRLVIAQRTELAKLHFKKASFSRKEYMLLFQDLSTATASRDLNYAVVQKIMKASGTANKTKYTFLS